MGTRGCWGEAAATDSWGTITAALPTAGHARVAGGSVVVVVVVGVVVGVEVEVGDVVVVEVVPTVVVVEVVVVLDELGDAGSDQAARTVTVAAVTTIAI